MFCISFVVVTVRARLVGFDRHVEEAAMDLGANEYVTFWKITLPLIAPGILAGALLAFSLSIDDFVSTSFNSGTTETVPLYVWSQAQRGVPPEVNVIGTSILVASLLRSARACSGCAGWSAAHAAPSLTEAGLTRLASARPFWMQSSGREP
jgi:spermidine/putrescine transport system permease protein